MWFGSGGGDNSGTYPVSAADVPDHTAHMMRYDTKAAAAGVLRQRVSGFEASGAIVGFSLSLRKFRSLVSVECNQWALHPRANCPNALSNLAPVHVAGNPGTVPASRARFDPAMAAVSSMARIGKLVIVEGNIRCVEHAAPLALRELR